MHLINKFLFLVILLGFLNSCQTSKQTLYGKCGKHYFVCTQLLIKPNNEFEYFQFYDVGGVQVVKGSWKENDDTLILNTWEQQKDRLSHVSEIRNDTLNGNIIEFENADFGFVEINGIKIKHTGKKIYFEEKAKEIKFLFYGERDLFEIIYKVRDSNSNYFLVKTKELESSIFFTDEKFLLKGRKIYPIGRLWPLEKTALSKKQW